MYFPSNAATTNPWHLSLRNENYVHTKTYMQNVHSSFICNSSKVETIQMSSNRWRNKQRVVHPRRGIHSYVKRTLYWHPTTWVALRTFDTELNRAISEDYILRASISNLTEMKSFVVARLQGSRVGGEELCKYRGVTGGGFCILTGGSSYTNLHTWGNVTDVHTLLHRSTQPVETVPSNVSFLVSTVYSSCVRCSQGRSWTKVHGNSLHSFATFCESIINSS